MSTPKLDDFVDKVGNHLDLVIGMPKVHSVEVVKAEKASFQQELVAYRDRHPEFGEQLDDLQRESSGCDWTDPDKIAQLKDLYDTVCYGIEQSENGDS